MNVRVKNKVTQNFGFSIVEILIILAVVGIMTSAIIPLFLDVITVNKSAAYYSEAYKLTDSKIEELRSLSFENIDAQDGEYSEPENIGNLPNGLLIINITNVIEGVPEDGIREIIITITWNFKSEKTYTTSTLITEGGIGR